MNKSLYMNNNTHEKFQKLVKFAHTSSEFSPKSNSKKFISIKKNKNQNITLQKNKDDKEKFNLSNLTQRSFDKIMKKTKSNNRSQSSTLLKFKTEFSEYKNLFFDIPIEKLIESKNSLTIEPKNTENTEKEFKNKLNHFLDLEDEFILGLNPENNFLYHKRNSKNVINDAKKKIIKVRDSNPSTLEKEMKNNYNNIQKNNKKRVPGISKKVNYLDEIKNNAIKNLSCDLEIKKKDEIISDNKKIIELYYNKMNAEFVKIKKEKESLSKQYNDMIKKINEIENFNYNLKNSNEILTEQLNKLQEKYEELNFNNSELEEFKNQYKEISTKFPGHTLEKLVDKYKDLEINCLDLAKKINELEMDKIDLDKQRTNDLVIFENKVMKLNQASYKHSTQFTFLQKEIENNKNLKTNFDTLQNNYANLCKKIMEIFNDWNPKIPVFYPINDANPPKANLDDPLEMLDVMAKMAKISTTNSALEWVRKIIVSANHLQRKYFPENVNEKFDPNKIYERIHKYVTNMQFKIGRLEAEISVLKKKIKIDKIDIRDKNKNKTEISTNVPTLESLKSKKDLKSCMKDESF